MYFPDKLELILDRLGTGYRIFLTQQVNDEKSQLYDFLVSIDAEKPICIPDVKLSSKR